MSGHPFGGVYFGTYAQMQRIENWSLNYYLSSRSQRADGEPPLPPVGDPVQFSAKDVTLRRTSYKLNPDTAKNLAAFLKDNLKTAILEIKSDGEHLVLTTTPDVEQRVEGLIQLLRGLGGMPASTNSFGDEVFTLNRVTYKLKPAFAESFSALLKDNKLMEVRSEGDIMVVTAAPEVQQQLDEFIRYFQGNRSAPPPKNPTAPTRSQQGANPASRRIAPPLGDYSGPDPMK